MTHSTTPSSKPSSSWQPATNVAIKKLKFIVLGGANAGKTSILRKYFHGNFDPARRPTVGSDFYTKKMSNPVTERGEDDSSSAEDEKKETGPTVTHEHPKAMLSMQVWDTPGRERFAANQTKPMYTAAFSDSFFKNADAALMVYDITSSTSFTHVLKWYEDLMMRIRRLEASGGRTRPFPVLIVGNKIDILRERDTHPSRQRAVVPQRDVMGLLDTSFRGKDSHYEYTASAPQNDSTTSLSSGKKREKKIDRNRHELSTYMGTGEKTNYLQAVLNNEVQIGSYLESLLSTEDGSHPDRDMVLLWCMRNGLKHMEVSALDGTGIEELVNEAINMALEAGESLTSSSIDPENESTQVLKLAELGRNDELDLHGRYVPKEQSCFTLPFRLCCKPR
jgi:small GTP-binding protein